MNAQDAAHRHMGGFVYAGGIELKRSDASRFGGLSDLVVRADGHLSAVSDEGQLLDGRLRLDPTGHLTGLDEIVVRPLTDAHGEPLRDKAVADAEGVARLDTGDLLVSFERQHRIWRYPAAGGLPVSAPVPREAAALPLNAGLEGLAALPEPGAYLTGSEGGTVWQCELDAGCRHTRLGAHLPKGFGLSALAVSPDGRVVGLVARHFEPERGVRVVVRLLPRAALTSVDVKPAGELVLDAPLTRDNVEGLAIVAGAGRSLRLYLLSDNNFSAEQHTYLLAFDWTID